MKKTEEKTKTESESGSGSGSETKTCKKCNHDKPFSSFDFENKSEGTLRAVCKDCRKTQREQKKDELKETMNENPTSEKKQCNTCGLDFPKSTEYFGIASGNKDGLRNICITCRKITDPSIKLMDDYFKKELQEHEEEIKNFKVAIDISIEEIKQKFLIQKKKCAFCTYNIGVGKTLKQNVAKLYHPKMFTAKNTKNAYLKKEEYALICANCYKSENITFQKIESSDIKNDEIKYTKICVKCEIEKNKNLFDYSPNNADGKKNKCKDCIKQEENEKYENLNFDEKIKKRIHNMIRYSKKDAIDYEKEGKIFESEYNLNFEGLYEIYEKQMKKCFITETLLDHDGENMICMKRIDPKRGFTLDNIIFVKKDIMQINLNNDFNKKSKKCINCHEDKLITEYNLKKKKYWGTKNICKSCENLTHNEESRYQKAKQKKELFLQMKR